MQTQISIRRQKALLLLITLSLLGGAIASLIWHGRQSLNILEQINNFSHYRSKGKFYFNQREPGFKASGIVQFGCNNSFARQFPQNAGFQFFGFNPFN